MYRRLLSVYGLQEIYNRTVKSRFVEFLSQDGTFFRMNNSNQQF